MLAAGQAARRRAAAARLSCAAAHRLAARRTPRAARRCPRRARTAPATAPASAKRGICCGGAYRATHATCHDTTDRTSTRRRSRGMPVCRGSPSSTLLLLTIVLPHLAWPPARAARGQLGRLSACCPRAVRQLPVSCSRPRPPAQTESEPSSACFTVFDFCTFAAPRPARAKPVAPCAHIRSWRSQLRPPSVPAATLTLAASETPAAFPPRTPVRTFRSGGGAGDARERAGLAAGQQ